MLPLSAGAALLASLCVAAAAAAGTPARAAAADASGAPYAWGFNSVGELGDGTTTSHNSPEVIALAAGVKPTAVSAAGFDGMAIGSDGNLYAWGSSTATINGTLETFGELGDGTTSTHDSPEVITLATGVAPVTVSAGASHR
jgi:alpha-tubulin suppressor-like RCC1 family protein